MAFTEYYISSSAGGAGNGLSAGSPWTFNQMKADIIAGNGPGRRYNIKADGTYARGTVDDDMSAGVAGSSTTPIYIRGYNTTIGDGYLGRDSSGALITTNMPYITYTVGFFKTPSFTVTESLKFERGSTGGGERIFYHTNHNSATIGCWVATARTNTDTWAAIAGGDYALCFECDFFLTATTGPNEYVVSILNAGARLDSCRIINSSSTIKGGIRSDYGGYVYGCLIKGVNTGAGIYLDDPNRPMHVRNCTIANWQDGVFYNSASTGVLGWVAGNMLTDCTRYGFNINAAWAGIIGPNRTRDCASGDTNNATSNWALAGRMFPLAASETGGPETDYVNAAGNNYNLIQASPAKGKNIPKISDLGAYGLADPAGGGGSAVFHSLENFIIQPVAA